MGFSHNFIHNPYFRWRPVETGCLPCWNLSRLDFPKPSTNMCIIGTIWETATGPMKKGETVDWLSIYRPRTRWRGRETSGATFFLAICETIPKRSLEKSNGKAAPDAYWGVFRDRRFSSVSSFLMGILNWKFILFFLPFYYLGALSLLSERVLPAFRRESG